MSSNNGSIVPALLASTNDEVEIRPFSPREIDERKLNEITGKAEKTGKKVIGVPSTFPKAECHDGLTEIYTHLCAWAQGNGIDPKESGLIPSFLPEWIDYTVSSRAGRGATAFDPALLQKLVDETFASLPRVKFANLALLAMSKYNCTVYGEKHMLTQHKVIELLREGLVSCPVKIPPIKERAKKSVNASDVQHIPGQTGPLTGEIVTHTVTALEPPPIFAESAPSPKGNKRKALAGA